VTELKKPENKNFNLTVTLQKAIENFTAKSPQEMAQKSGCIFDEERKCFYVNCIGQNFSIGYPKGNIQRVDDSNKEVPLIWQILMLHYLTEAKGTPLQNKVISYKELPGGNIYIDPFNKRTLKPLLKIFGNNPEKLLAVGEKLNGKPANYGDYSITIKSLPRAPITYVLWQGDDEFPASGNVLFDASAPDYLHTEDYAFLASFTVYEMAKHLS
jgi:hypothetical protein